MRLADDERGRVPFALVGVLLLVGSLGVSTVQLDGERVDRDVRIAGDRAEAAAEASLRDAVADAGATAAADPVTEPADAAFGSLLADDRPFRSQLELLVALRLRERAAGSEQRVDRTTARIELSPIENRTTARRALERTSVEAAGTGLVAATVQDVRVVVERDGRVVAERRRNLSVTVATPALELHDRTAEFERRLDGGLGTPGSVTRGLTGGLYGLGWARGWAQYAGLPIEEPIANRHVELVANLAAIDAQRSAFGTADREAEEGLAAASVRVAAAETVGFESGGFAEAALPEPNGETPSPGEVASPPTRTVTVGVNESADRALADVLRASPRGVSDGHPAARPLAEIVRDATTIEARLATAREPGPRELEERTGPTNRSDWRVERGEAAVSVRDVENGSGPDPRAGPGWTTRAAETRRVTLVETVPLTYVHEETGRTFPGEATYERQVGVGVAVATRPAPLAAAPNRGVVPGRDRLAERLASRAEREVLGADRNVDAVAADAAAGRAGERRVSVVPDDVGDRADAVYDDLARLREELRTVETETERAFVATEDDPAATLRRRLRADRSAYVGAPPRYRDLEQRAVVAARALYVDRTVERVDARSQVQQSTRDALVEEVEAMGAMPEAGLDQLLSLGTDYARPEPAPVAAQPPARDLRFSVRGEPGYLERDAVAVRDGSRANDSDVRYRPLATRTRTLPSLQAEDVAGAVGGAVADEVFDVEGTVPLPLAARTLAATRDVPDAAAANGTLVEDRAQLRAGVADAVGVLDERSARVVAERTGLDRPAADAVVLEATGEWERPADLALAYDDGSAADAIAATAAYRAAVSERDANRTRTVLGDEIERALGSEATHVESATVQRAADEARAVTERVVTNATERGLDRAAERLDDRFDRAPLVGLRGSPVVPVPGYWVATANVWHAEVRGTYASFSVGAPRGGPAGGAIEYERDGSTARLDVTGDGTPERLGRAERLSFDASTTVVVAVPPSSGVGNADTEFEQASPGWEQWAERGRAEDGGREYHGGLASD